MTFLTMTGTSGCFFAGIVPNPQESRFGRTPSGDGDLEIVDRYEWSVQNPIAGTATP